MTYIVYFSPQSEYNLRELIDFLRNKWNDKVVESLLNEIDKSIGLISKNPEIFPVFSKRKNIRKCVVKRRTILLYRLKPKMKEIEIVYLSDARKDSSRFRYQ